MRPGRARRGARGGRGGDARVDDAARHVADHRRDLGERGGEQQGQLAAARSADHAETVRRHARPASEPADGRLEVLERDLHQVGGQVLGAEVREGERGEPVRREQRGHALGEAAVGSSDHEHARTRRPVRGREERPDEAVVANRLAGDARAHEAAPDPDAIGDGPVHLDRELDVERAPTVRRSPRAARSPDRARATRGARTDRRVA